MKDRCNIPHTLLRESEVVPEFLIAELTEQFLAVPVTVLIGLSVAFISQIIQIVILQEVHGRIFSIKEDTTIEFQ